MDSNKDVKAGDFVLFTELMTVGKYGRTAARILRDGRERIVVDSWSMNVANVVLGVANHAVSCGGSKTILKHFSKPYSSKKGIQGTKARSYLDCVSGRGCR